MKQMRKIDFKNTITKTLPVPKTQQTENTRPLYYITRISLTADVQPIPEEDLVDGVRVSVVQQ